MFTMFICQQILVLSCHIPILMLGKGRSSNVAPEVAWAPAKDGEPFISILSQCIPMTSNASPFCPNDALRRCRAQPQAGRPPPSHAGVRNTRGPTCFFSLRRRVEMKWLRNSTRKTQKSPSTNMYTNISSPPSFCVLVFSFPFRMALSKSAPGPA